MFDLRFAKFLLESMADGVFTLDKNGIITYWNPAMEKITGYQADEITGKSCNILAFDRCLNKRCPNGTHECGIFEKGAVDGKECRLQHKNGSEVSVLKSARLVKDDKKEIIGIVETVTDITELKKARQQAMSARQKLKSIFMLDNIIGKSDSMRHIFSLITASANSDASILIQGESGTGKEMVAHAIHYQSERAKNPIITINCSALTESVLESELFGHIKGAFTGATRDRKGRFEEASTGTVFLDEIGDISPFIQLKLLRVLQERKIERVGESLSRSVDIRIIAATNKNLLELTRHGVFREDLYYRLKVFPITIPPLRERKEDIPLLVEHFILNMNKKQGKKIVGLSAEAIRAFMDYSWPGNVRELENAIEHAFVLCVDEFIQLKDLPLEQRMIESTYPPILSGIKNYSNHKGKKLSREILLQLLDEANWNKAEVARRIGVSRTAVWKYMKKWDIPLQRDLLNNQCLKDS